MIRSFKGKDTESVFNGIYARSLPADIQKRAKHKLDLINFAGDLKDLRLPPSNNLEALKGGRKGQYSIRINRQWRICFKYGSRGFEEVEITDYH